MSQHSAWRVAAVCLLIACERGSYPSDGGDSYDAGEPAIDSGIKGDAGMPAVKYGKIQLYQLEIDAGVGSSVVSMATGTFSEIVGCFSLKKDSCEVLSCDYPPPSTPKETGMLSIEGIQVDGGIRLESSASGIFASFVGKFWDEPGRPIKIVTTGGDVPAFSVSFTSPNKVTVVPPCTSSACTLRRDQPLVLTWPERPLETQVELTVTSLTATKVVVLRCVAPAAAGSIEISPEWLNYLEPSNQATCAWLSGHVQDFRAGDWDITVVATDNAQSQRLNIE